MSRRRHILACVFCAAASVAWSQAAHAQAQEAAPPGDENLSPTDQGREEGIIEGFRFGSYGRVVQGSDLRGGLARQVRVVSRAPRLLESNYVELDFGYRQEWAPTGTTFDARITLAMAEDLFHSTGRFDSQMAIRNLYLEVRDPMVEGLSAWAGSRMVRGDDVYLLDFWPLDEQNTVGGGVAYQKGRDSLKAHVGLTRLEDPFQIQTIQVPSDEFGARDVLLLDRPRVVTSLRGERHTDLSPSLVLKTVLYGEFHHLGAGTRLDENDEPEGLPKDTGVLGGVQLGLYEPGTANYVNVFARYGANLAAFDELAIPADLAADDSTKGARELILAVSANQEWSEAGVLLGGYARRFEDADGALFDVDDGWEVGAAVRPAWFVTDVFHLIGEVNTQIKRPNGVFQETGLQEVPMVLEVAAMPTLSLGRGSYARPQLRLVYAATFLNDSALLTYAPDDPQRDHPVRHFLGLSMEWWFNSSRG